MVSFDKIKNYICSISEKRGSVLFVYLIVFTIEGAKMTNANKKNCRYHFFGLTRRLMTHFYSF